ncbi:hypothetical protein GCM10010195_69980 [Kitasatospora griseola]|nr:hypothetical protein GCM10010195_69980 [Kitasatospora griseola]
MYGTGVPYRAESAATQAVGVDVHSVLRPGAFAYPSRRPPVINPEMKRPLEALGATPKSDGSSAAGEAQSR